MANHNGTWGPRDREETECRRCGGAFLAAERRTRVKRYCPRCEKKAGKKRLAKLDADRAARAAALGISVRRLRALLKESSGAALQPAVDADRLHGLREGLPDSRADLPRGGYYWTETVCDQWEYPNGDGREQRKRAKER